MKKHTSIPFSNLESIPQLVKDFLAQKVEGYEDKFYSFENISKQISDKKQSFTTTQRKILVEALTDQHLANRLTESQKQNLVALSSPNTFTVTTGHQLNLFTGPAFFIYKIMQTIRIAEEVSFQNDGFNVVPIFWMASEDHDFEEINHFQTENEYYETKAKSGGPVGRIKVEDDYFIKSFEEEFKDTVFGTELILLLKKAYKKGQTLATATRILVQELFGKYGVLILDGDDVRLKRQMVEVFKSELFEEKLFSTTKNQVDSLAGQYGKVQVNPREINLFYLDAERNRIEAVGNYFTVVDSDLSFSKEEIVKELETHPEKFSPNALLRPIFQETVLPNLAYIGGNAEIMYWLELKPYFTSINLPFPVLVPRNSLLFLDSKTISKIEKEGLKVEDFFRNFAEVTKSLLLDNNEILCLLDASESIIANQFDEISKNAVQTDKTFGSLVDAEKTRQIKAFKRMRKRLLRAEKIKQQEKLQRLEDLFLNVHPGRSWQERVYNFSVFYADHGHDWLEACYQESHSAQPQIAVLSI